MNIDVAPARRSTKKRNLAIVAIAAAVLAALAWSAPREQVPVPGKDATPEEVVRAYVRAVNARDFATSNEISDIDDHSRFSRPATIELESVERVEVDDAHALVEVLVEFVGSQTHNGGLYSYGLERGKDGHWHIVSAGNG